ncbi:MAG: hypothetical protein J5916_01470 [Oscillospiraceae bacterium]|nr:hypothetical protein [Oscillospiraceae bacterium]
MKKIILALVLVLAVGLSACGPSAGSAQQPAADNPTETPSTVPSLPQEKQLEILEANRSSWEFRDPYESPWFYVFTDLDLNGRLEVIAASTQGSGIYTYVNFYEVRSDGSGIDNLYHANVEIEGPDDWPEIVLESLPCYYDAAGERYYYPCEGVTRDGYAHQYYSWQALCLKNGVADWEFIASKNVDWDENGSDTTECRDAQGNVISLQDYDSAVERRFAGMQKMELKLNWTQVEIPFEGEPVETAMAAANQTQSTEPAVQQDFAGAANADDAAVYSSVIEQYKTAFEPGNSRNAEYAWTNGLSEMIEYASGVGYALEDLDGNGIRELIIAGLGTDDFSEKNIFALYTLEDGAPVPIAISYARMRYYLQSDNTIRYVGSSGAFHTNIVRSRLNGSSLETIEMIFTTEQTAPDGSLYAACYYQEGDSERIPSEKSVKISEEDFRMRLEQMEADTALPELTLIAGN